MINLKNLNVSIANQEVIKNLDLKINAGEVHVVMGLNGSGKSTLLNLLLALMRQKPKGRLLI